jgi:hypothetical protein
MLPCRHDIKSLPGCPAKSRKRNLPNWPGITAYCMHDYSRDQETRLNVIGRTGLRCLEIEALIIAIDALPISCTLLTLNRGQPNLIQSQPCDCAGGLIEEYGQGKERIGLCGRLKITHVFVGSWIKNERWQISQLFIPEPITSGKSYSISIIL